MQLKFYCEHCNSRLEAENAQFNTQVNCPHCDEVIIVPKPSLEPGITIGDFLIDKVIGAGGMGQVFLATQRSMDRTVALKVLPPTLTAKKELIDRFLHEVKVSARLHHPNIVAAHSAGEDDGHYYLAMSYVDGVSLEEKLREEGRLKETDVLEVADKLADALDYAWSDHKMLHRDIKPANIMLDSRGEVKLLDMGIAKHIGEETGLTMTGQFIGTPNYVSPEQARGEKDLDCRADIYSLGITMYHLLTGKQPFEGESLYKILIAILNTDAPPANELNPELSAPCVGLLQRMMAKERDDRPADWKALKKEIQVITSGDATVMAQTAGPDDQTAMAAPPALPKEKKKSSTLKAGCLAVAVMFFLLFLIAAGQNKKRLRQETVRAQQLLEEAQTLVDDERFQEAIDLIDREAPGIAPRAGHRDEIEQLHQYASAYIQMRREVDDALAHIEAGRPEEARRILGGLAKLAPDDPSTADWKRDLLAIAEKAIETRLLKRRLTGFIEAMVTNSRDTMADYIDPHFRRKRGDIAVRAQVAIVLGLTKLAKLGTDDVDVPEIQFDEDNASATVIMRMRSKNSEWHELPPARWQRVEGEWYLAPNKPGKGGPGPRRPGGGK
jgi:hypothetical protein